MSTDFNGDGRDDILWRHPSSTYAYWYGTGSGGFIGTSRPLFAEIPSSTFVVGAIDIFNSGVDDVLWRDTDGTLHIYTRDAYDDYIQDVFAAYVPIEWTVLGTGDFNGDGRDDILWRHANGTLTDWLGQAGETFFSNHANAAHAVGLAWHWVGTGDFNGDGRDDILWRHDNGTVTDWLGQGDGSFAGNYATAAYAIDQAWRVIGTGDFNGDGRADILWRHDNGTITDWLGQADGSFAGNYATAAYAVDQSWQVLGTGDFNGDGRDDILWRHDNGTVTDWLGQADATFASNFANAAHWIDAAWQYQPDPSGAGYWDY